MKTNYVDLRPPWHARRILCMLSLMTALFAGDLAAANVSFKLPIWTKSLPVRLCCIGHSLQVYQELDIRFNPSLYGTLSNGSAPSDSMCCCCNPITCRAYS
jgi:hypothetical protein